MIRAVATATFSESTRRRIGTETRMSTSVSTRIPNPVPSAPTRRSCGPVRSVSYRSVPPRGTAATIVTPRRRADLTRESTESAIATGILKVLPMAPRRARHPNGSADAGATTTPPAPPASAARMIAPMLPGSWTPTGHTTRPRRVCLMTRSYGQGAWVARATAPEGVRTGLIASRTEAVAARVRTPELIRALDSRVVALSCS